MHDEIQIMIRARSFLVNSISGKHSGLVITTSRWSLRGRVMVVVACAHLGIAAMAAWLLILNAREAIQGEVQASLDLSSELTKSIISTVLQLDDPSAVVGTLSEHLPAPRHARIMLLNATGDMLWSQARKRDPAGTVSPDWFAAMIAPPIRIERIPISLHWTIYGSVVIATEPLDEIDEVWRDFRDLLILFMLAFLALLLLLHLLLGRALQPISIIAAGLEELEQGYYALQLPVITVPDLHRIGVRVNALAKTLDTTTQDKDELGRQLVTLQDDERKLIAMELHDEFGPCLFGIGVDARYVDAASRRISGKDSIILAERAQSILLIVERMQQHSRSMLKRLRPMALGKVPIGDLLEDLIASFATREPGIRWIISSPTDQSTFGETLDLTLYRLVQECLTNAARHAQATCVNIVLSVHDASSDHDQVNRSTNKTSVLLIVEDNGLGLPENLEYGRGLSGMRQRVQILGGQFEVAVRSGGGTRISASVPLHPFNNSMPKEEDIQV